MQDNAEMLQNLRLRAHVLREIRDFFADGGITEVTTPCLIPAPASEPQLDSFAVPDGGWLRTSPENAMKCLLARGAGDIFQVGPVFRKGERGHLHRPEFTMLEWYRTGWDYHRLLKECDRLLRRILSLRLQLQPSQAVSFETLFADCLGLDPFTCDDKALVQAAAEHGFAGCSGRADALDFLIGVATGKCFKPDRLTAVYDFPPEQASLAQLSPRRRAQRFEIFHGGIELANGYQELTRPGEYRTRFESDNATRIRCGRPEVPVDEDFLKILEQGALPECTGVAVGLDRLLMCLAKARDIAAVQPPPATAR